MKNLLKLLFILFIFLLITGCEGKNNQTSNPDYRLVSETHEGDDPDLYFGMYLPGDSNVTYTYDTDNRLASMVFVNTPYYNIAIYPSVDQIETFEFEYQTDTDGKLLERTIYMVEANGSKMATDITTLVYENGKKIQTIQKSDWFCDGSLDKIETHYFDSYGHLEKLTIDWDAISFYTFDPSIAGNYYYSTSSFLVNITGFLEAADGNTDVTAEYQYNTDGILQSYAVVFNTPDTDENVSLVYNASGLLTDINTTFVNIHNAYGSNQNVIKKTFDYLNNYFDIDQEYEYTYNSRGELETTKKTSYVPLAAPTTTSTTDTREAITYTTSYKYDDHGNMITMESDFETLSFDYDFSYEQKGLMRTIREHGIDYARYELSYDENDNLIQVVYYDNQNLIPTKISKYTWEKIQ